MTDSTISYLIDTEHDGTVIARLLLSSVLGFDPNAEIEFADPQDFWPDYDVNADGSVDFALTFTTRVGKADAERILHFARIADGDERHG